MHLAEGIAGETVLDAKNVGTYEASILWKTGGYDCTSITTFEQFVKREIFQECKESYMNINVTNQQQMKIRACEIGATEVIEEKRQSCGSNQDCSFFGGVVSGPVAAILCHYIHPPYSIMITETCIPTAVSSCTAAAISNIQDKINRGECDNLNLTSDIMEKTQHLCDAFVRAFSYQQFHHRKN